MGKEKDNVIQLNALCAIPHSSFRIHHSAFIILHSSFRIHHSALIFGL